MEEGSFGRNIAIVGLGLIGGSYAKALRQLNSGSIFGIDIDKSVLDRAVNSGIIDRGDIGTEAILSRSDMVIIALYPKDTVEFIANYSGCFRPGTIVTDTCGIKQPIINAAKKHLPEGVEFIGGHPMAGNEFQGFEAASPELFLDTNYILTPHEDNSSDGIMAVEKLALSIGCRRVTRIEAEEHDRMISFTSQLPHIVAISFANLAAGEKDMDAFTGRSFRDATRVAALNKELWKQIFRMNSRNIIERIEDMETMLRSLKNIITEKDENSLAVLFDNAVKGKRVIDR